MYLSLFLASKLAITIPFLSSKATNQSDASFHAAFPSRSSTAPLSAQPILPTNDHSGHSKDSSTNIPNGAAASTANLDVRQIAARNQAASPPVYLLALAFIPTGAAMYIAATRFSDFRHHGFDILSGFFIGTVNAFWAFRYYHLPISRGAGWSWGPRSRDRAFWAGVGTGGYVGNDDEGETGRKRHDDEVMAEASDIEAGSADGGRERRDLNRSGRDTVGGDYSRTPCADIDFYPTGRV